jgi:hypothetical protein
VEKLQRIKMKSLHDYISESDHAASNPVAGDAFAINIREECLIESVVVESRADGVVIAADDRMIELLESYGYSFEESALTESHFAVGDRVQCRKSGMKGRVVKLDKDHGDDDDQYYTIKRDDGQLKKMAPEDMTKLDEQVMSFDNNQQDPDPGEYDDEGDMAKNELYTMIRSARKLIGMLDNDDNMPEWTQKKITKATDYVDTASDYISSQKERGVMEGDSEPNPVARAVLHRILMQHTGLLAAHGPERVMNAVDEVADRVNIGPDDEIGSSDVSAYVREVERALSEQGMAEGGFNDDGSYNTSDDEATDFDEYDFDDTELGEAEYQGRKVPLGKPMQGDVKKSKVYVKDPVTGNVKKVNFGDPNMKIKKSNPARRKNFRARHNCDNPGPRTKARYWSCRAW